MVRSLVLVGSTLVGLALLGAGLSYSWTFTPLGRLNFQAAVIAKISSLRPAGELEMTPETRAAANRISVPSRGGFELDPSVRFEDRGGPHPPSPRRGGGPKIGFQYSLVPATDLSGTMEWPSNGAAGWRE